MGASRLAGKFVLVIISLFYIYSPTFAQNVGQRQYMAPNSIGSAINPFESGPSNPLSQPMGGLIGPREQDSILLTPRLFQGILPNIPNLKAGYLYSFGDGVESGRLSLELLQPVKLGKSSIVFGQFHNQWRDFWKTVTRGANHRIDLSLGGGYRTILGNDTLIGVNAFYDTTRLGSKWYDSGGVGAEFAALLPGRDVVDLSFNWYGNLFNSNVLANAFRRGPDNYDFQAGYSHELYGGGPDLRLHAAGYRFSSGAGVYGYKGGAELKSRDGMFSVRYEAAHDRVNDTYHTVGGFINVGLQLENLLSGDSPFIASEPIFASPRNWPGKRLQEPVQRLYGGPKSIVLTRAQECCEGRVRICDVLLKPSNFPFWLVKYLNGEFQPPGSLTGKTVVLTWCRANEDPARNSADVAVFQGAPGNPQRPYFELQGFDMSASNGQVVLNNLTLPAPSARNWFAYQSGPTIDLRDGGCICIDW